MTGRKARVLLVTQGYPPDVGGSERYVRDLAQGLRERGHYTSVLAVSPSPVGETVDTERGILWRIPQAAMVNAAAFAPGFFARFLRAARGHDVIHFNFPFPMAEVAALASRRALRGRRIIVTYHADIVPRLRFSAAYNRLVTRRFLAMCDRIIVASPQLAGSSPHLRPFRRKVAVVPFGIAVETGDAPAPEERDEGLELLFVGRLVRHKGIDVLLRALANAPGVLHVVGAGPYADAARALAATLGLASRTVFHGHLSDADLRRRYASADVLVLPSTDRAEAFGYVLMEAGIQHTALVSTELGTGTSFVNEDGRTGFVVAPGDAAALANAIRRLHRSPELLRELKRNAHERVSALFRLDRMIEATLDLYAADGGPGADEPASVRPLAAAPSG